MKNKSKRSTQKMSVAPVKRFTPPVCSYTTDRRIVVQVVEEEKHTILLHNVYNNM